MNKTGAHIWLLYWDYRSTTSIVRIVPKIPNKPRKFSYIGMPFPVGLKTLKYERNLICPCLINGNMKFYTYFPSHYLTKYENGRVIWIIWKQSTLTTSKYCRSPNRILFIIKLCRTQKQNICISGTITYFI